MNILIIGGTRFLGRALVEEALIHGHTLTLFNRGISNRSLFPQVKQIHGDRTTDLNLLNDGTWDAVIDTCGYVPRIVHSAAALLCGKVGSYTFISTISVYTSPVAPYAGEETSIAQLPDPTTEEITGETYGALKACCEHEVQRFFPEKNLIIRPGLIVGPFDPTDRFTYWVKRAAEGGEILSPGRPERLVEWIDVRDLAAFIISMVERHKTGIFNATGPSTAMRDLLQSAVEVGKYPSLLTWVPDAFLLEQQVEPWKELPLWIPDSDPESTTLCHTNCDRAVHSGLTFRSPADTISATLAWLPQRPADQPWRAGMNTNRETEILSLWKTHCREQSLLP